MKIVVEFYARAREIAGVDQATVELSEGATVREVRAEFGRRWPDLAALLAKSAIAVDEQYAQDAMVIVRGARVAVLPPVSGG